MRDAGWGFAKVEGRDREGAVVGGYGAAGCGGGGKPGRRRALVSVGTEWARF